MTQKKRFVCFFFVLESFLEVDDPEDAGAILVLKFSTCSESTGKVTGSHRDKVTSIYSQCSTALFPSLVTGKI